MKSVGTTRQHASDLYAKAVIIAERVFVQPSLQYVVTLKEAAE
jgi:hypothetical protein